MVYYWNIDIRNWISMDNTLYMHNISSTCQTSHFYRTKNACMDFCPNFYHRVYNYILGNNANRSIFKLENKISYIPTYTFIILLKLFKLIFITRFINILK